MDLEDKKEKLISSTLFEIEEERNLVKSLLLSHNYKNSELVGKILVNDNSIKPKKKLIILVSFITGFILSIFIVFFLNFIRTFKEEKND